MAMESGDLVRLKSGGALMTVASIEKDYGGEEQVYCIWTEMVKGRAEVMREPFPEIVLEKSSKPKSGSIRVSR